MLARYHVIAEPLGRRATEEQLWRLAERHTPRERLADYTQAIMDLGATVCTRAHPDCPRCPLARGCQARRAGDPRDYPVRAARRPLPVRKTRMLLIRDGAERVLLQQRPPAGLWGGLWSLPECDGADVRRWCRAHLGLDIEPERPWPVRRHRFTHFRLDITPVPARVVGEGRSRHPAARGTRTSLCIAGPAMENAASVWYNLERADARGLAAPVKTMLERLRASRSVAECS